MMIDKKHGFETVLQQLDGANKDELAELMWARFDQRLWPILFELIDLAADYPGLYRLQEAFDSWAANWPEFATTSWRLAKLQALANHPILLKEAVIERIFSSHELGSAITRLTASHCVTIDFLLKDDERTNVLKVIDGITQRRGHGWLQLSAEEAPDFFSFFRIALADPVLRQLTGFDAVNGPLQATLSLQSLDASGIAWHRDLYWPLEWVGQNVCAIFCALSDDDATKGGAFIHYDDRENQICAVYRRRWDATILLNGALRAERPLHAVTKYHGANSIRNLIILQCLCG